MAVALELSTFCSDGVKGGTGGLRAPHGTLVLCFPLAKRVTLEFSWEPLATAWPSVLVLVLPLSSDLKGTQIKQPILEQTRVGVSADELRGSLVAALRQSKLALGVT